MGRYTTHRGQRLVGHIDKGSGTLNCHSGYAFDRESHMHRPLGDELNDPSWSTTRR